MAEVTMPRLSDTMEEGTIATWLKKPGDAVSRGDVLAQIETDKATMDLTAFEAGTLQEILAPEGTTVQIGKPVARIGSGKSAPQPSGTEGGQPSKARGAEPSETDRAEPSTRAAEQVPEEDGGQASKTPGVETSETDGGQPTVGEGAPPSGPDRAGPSTRGAEQPSGTDAGQTSARERDQPSGTEGSQTPKTPGAEQPSGMDGDQPSEISRAESSGTDGSQASKSPEVEPSGGGQSSPAANGKVRASPMARHIAAEHGLDLSDIHGSGPQGRVIRADVEAALGAPAGQDALAPGQQAQETSKPQPQDAQPGQEGSQAQTQSAQPAQDGDERIALSQMRRTIARRMAESTRTVPHFFLTTVVDATELGALRKQINDQTAEANGVKVSFNDLIVKGAALAIRKVPEVNVSFAEDSLIRHSRVNVGIAVATDRGLIVPVLRDADLKSLGAIAKETRDLADKANNGKLQPPDYSGGTFTVSNLGMFGVEQFQAVINPPESAILAVGAISKEPAEYHGEIALRDRLRLTLSVDHRALDGAVGARYLQALKALLEKPMLLLV